MRGIDRRSMAMLIVSALSPWAANAQPPCLPPSDVGHHPLFAGLSFRPDVEFIGDDWVPGVATSAAFGDLDGDGRPDAVVSATEYITVMLNRGGGVFAPPTPYEAGDRETFVALADMDGDQHLDVLVCNALGDSISVLLGRGDGTLQGAVSYDAGDEPQSLIAEDLDGDGDLDVAVLHVLSSDIWIYLNDGNAVLSEHARIPISSVSPRGDPNRTFPYPGPFLAAGDLNGDGNTDLAVPAFNRVHLLFGDGTGGFVDAHEHARSPLVSVYNVKLADLNADGELDIAASIATGPSWMAVWLNAGDGSFPQADTYESSWAGRGPLYFNIGLAIGDFSTDGMPDIALGSEFVEGVPVHHNLGDGTFGGAQALPAFEHSWSVDASDVSGDGTTDLLILSERVRSALRIRLNDGHGNLRGPVRMPVDARLGSLGSRRTIDAANLDADADMDLIVSLHKTARFLHRIELFENNGVGVFVRAGEITLDQDGESSVEDLFLEDVSGDGLPELFVADTTVSTGWVEPGTLWLIENRRGSDFDAHILHAFAASYPTRLAMHDFDGDGRLDPIILHHSVFPGDDNTPVERRLMILRNLGGSQFELAADWAIGSSAWFPVDTPLGVGDVTGDGNTEIVAGFGSRGKPGELVVYRHDGGFDFTEIARTTIPPHAQNLVLADLDHDGRDEIAILHDHNTVGAEMEPYLSIYRVNEAFDLEPIEAWTDPGVFTVGDIVAEDLDRDGNIDLALGDVSGRVIVHLGRGDATFGPAVGYDTTHGAFALAIADFDGDGRKDIASTSISTEIISIQYNRSCYTPCLADLTGSSDPRENTYGVPDLDVDSDDFFFYLDAFVSANTSICDVDHDGDCDADDFFAYLDLFAAGC